MEICLLENFKNKTFLECITAQRCNLQRMDCLQCDSPWMDSLQSTGQKVPPDSCKSFTPRAKSFLDSKDTEHVLI